MKEIILGWNFPWNNTAGDLRKTGHPAFGPNAKTLSFTIMSDFPSLPRNEIFPAVLYYF